MLVDSLIASFGLTKAADTLVGTPLRKGISGGQKRRVSVASQLVTAPRILFLDEPTSGLDSAASYEVVSLLREVTRTYKLIVIVSIHQPSSTTFELFDKLCLLAAGKTCYFGPINRIQSYFDSIGYEMPLHTNPAEFILDLVNADFAGQRHDAAERVQKIQSSWTTTVKSGMLEWDTHTPVDSSNYPPCSDQASERLSLLRIVLVLLQRAFVKSYRDIVVYGVRYAMYFGALRNDQLLLCSVSSGDASAKRMPVCFVGGCRPGCVDGNRLGTSSDKPGVHSALHQRDRKSGSLKQTLARATVLT